LKEHLEHLRTVHFTLVLVSAALIILASKPVPSHIANAHQQIKDIITVAKLDYEWLPKYAESVVANSLYKDSYAQRFPNSPLVVEVQCGEREKDLLVLEFLEPNWTILDDRRPLPLLYPIWPLDRRIVVPTRKAMWLRSPQTLQDFRELWNSLDGLRFIYVPISLEPSIYFYGEVNRRCSWQRAKERTAPKSVTLHLEMLHPQDREHFELSGSCESPLAYVEIYSDGILTPDDVEIHYPTIIIPVEECHTIPLYAQMPLVSLFPDRWRPGSFEFVFEELNTVAAELPYPDATLEELEKLLGFQKKQVGEEAFELMGLKFPAGATATWGVMVLLVVQLYFWLHLEEFRRKHTGSIPADVAWIAVYPSRVARYVFGASAFLMPVTAVAVLQLHVVRTESLLSWQTLWASLSLVLAVWLSLLGRKSQPLPPPSPTFASLMWERWQRFTQKRH
jgi:hypothetical protein